MYVLSLWIKKRKEFFLLALHGLHYTFKDYPSYSDENGTDLSLQNEQILENSYLTEPTVTSESESSSSGSDSDQ